MVRIKWVNTRKVISTESGHALDQLEAKLPSPSSPSLLRVFPTVALPQSLTASSLPTPLSLSHYLLLMWKYLLCSPSFPSIHVLFLALTHVGSEQRILLGAFFTVILLSPHLVHVLRLIEEEQKIQEALLSIWRFNPNQPPQILSVLCKPQLHFQSDPHWAASIFYSFERPTSLSFCSAPMQNSSLPISSHWGLWSHAGDTFHLPQNLGTWGVVFSLFSVSASHYAISPHLSLLWSTRTN